MNHRKNSLIFKNNLHKMPCQCWKYPTKHEIVFDNYNIKQLLFNKARFLQT